ncbi:MAG TPA: hypothetical protein VM266_09940, partial [Solirubrobacteraceae bacterium]|nr:hypothetical protein [Solirubrobacteraceae bacterium]
THRRRGSPRYLAGMRKLLLVAIAVLALTAVLPAAPASARKSCGTVTKTYSYGSYTFAIS